MKKNLIASLVMLMLGAGIYAVSTHYMIPVPPVQTSGPLATPSEAEETTPEVRESAEETSAAEADETTDAYEPSPTELNLAHVFPEGVDSSDPTESFAGNAFHILMTQDEAWMSGIYDYSDYAPLQLASRLGRSRDQVMGSYNPEDNTHDPSDPDTWTINSFKDIRMDVTDGSGKPISVYSNVVEIMSMANVYTYYQNPGDLDLFLDYARALWEASHSYSVSMSDVYYCEGCLDEEGSQREIKALQEAARAEAEGRVHEDGTMEDASAPDPTSATPETSSAGSESAASPVVTVGRMKTAGAAAQTSVGSVSDSENSGSEDSVSSSENSGSGESASGSENTTVETGAAQAIEPTSGVILAGQAHKTSAASEEASGENSIQTLEQTSGEDSKQILGQTSEQELEQLPGQASESGSERMADQASDPLSGTISDTASASDADQLRNASLSETDPSQTLKCPGHIDLVIHMQIRGLNGASGLFSKDPIGNNAAHIQENGWPGWNEETKKYVMDLKEQDWFQKYGLSISVISMSNPLNSSEIEAYMNELPEGISQVRRSLIRFALSSVGRVPYHWGGKASKPDYIGNNFGAITSPDEKGRILKGLDCSGWINWVYWSVTGTRLPYESTSGLALCGTRIQRDQLQPGDIIIRTGGDAHVIMFLGWTSDGRIRCIHESSGNVNNVTVSIRDANWPYYIKLTE